jgi:hypothetical protein
VAPLFVIKLAAVVEPFAIVVPAAVVDPAAIVDPALIVDPAAIVGPAAVVDPFAVVDPAAIVEPALVVGASTRGTVGAAAVKGVQKLLLQIPVQHGSPVERHGDPALMQVAPPPAETQTPDGQKNPGLHCNEYSKTISNVSLRNFELRKKTPYFDSQPGTLTTYTCMVAALTAHRYGAFRSSRTFRVYCGSANYRRNSEQLEDSAEHGVGQIERLSTTKRAREMCFAFARQPWAEFPRAVCIPFCMSPVYNMSLNVFISPVYSVSHMPT